MPYEIPQASLNSNDLTDKERETLAIELHRTPGTFLGIKDKDSNSVLGIDEVTAYKGRLEHLDNTHTDFLKYLSMKVVTPEGEVTERIKELFLRPAADFIKKYGNDYECERRLNVTSDKDGGEYSFELFLFFQKKTKNQDGDLMPDSTAPKQEIKQSIKISKDEIEKSLVAEQVSRQLVCQPEKEGNEFYRHLKKFLWNPRGFDQSVNADNFFRYFVEKLARDNLIDDLRNNIISDINGGPAGYSANELIRYYLVTHHCDSLGQDSDLGQLYDDLFKREHVESELSKVNEGRLLYFASSAPGASFQLFNGISLSSVFMSGDGDKKNLIRYLMSPENGCPRLQNILGEDRYEKVGLHFDHQRNVYYLQAQHCQRGQEQQKTVYFEPPLSKEATWTHFDDNDDDFNQHIDIILRYIKQHPECQRIDGFNIRTFHSEPERFDVRLQSQLKNIFYDHVRAKKIADFLAGKRSVDRFSSIFLSNGSLECLSMADEYPEGGNPQLISMNALHQSLLMARTAEKSGFIDVALRLILEFKATYPMGGDRPNAAMNNDADAVLLCLHGMIEQYKPYITELNQVNVAVSGPSSVGSLTSTLRNGLDYCRQHMSDVHKHISITNRLKLWWRYFSFKRSILSLFKKQQEYFFGVPVADAVGGVDVNKNEHNYCRVKSYLSEINTFEKLKSLGIRAQLRLDRFLKQLFVDGLPNEKIKAFMSSLEDAFPDKPNEFSEKEIRSFLDFICDRYDANDSKLNDNVIDTATVMWKVGLFGVDSRRDHSIIIKNLENNASKEDCTLRNALESLLKIRLDDKNDYLCRFEKLTLNLDTSGSPSDLNPNNINMLRSCFEYLFPDTKTVSSDPGHLFWMIYTALDAFSSYIKQEIVSQSDGNQPKDQTFDYRFFANSPVGGNGVNGLASPAQQVIVA